MSDLNIELEKKDLAVDQRIKDEVEKVEKDIDTLSKITFMDSLLDKQTEIRNMLDVRSNIVIGFNSALIVLLVSYFDKAKFLSDPILWVIVTILILSLAMAIIALKPPHFSTKKGQKESLFYHHYINSKDIDEYRTEIHRVLKNEREIFDAYISETYNMTKYSNIPRKFYLYLSIRILIYGMAFIILIYLLDYLWKIWI